MSIKENLKKIQNEIQNRHPKQRVQILAVTKKQSLEVLKHARDCGLKSFGENYLQEALQKKQQLNDESVQWHFIGHLQSNKVKDVVGAFEYIHGVDRESVLLKINELAQKKLIVQKIFLQVNLANEASKSGIDEESLQSLYFQSFSLEAVQVCGLMIMPPFADDPEANRRYFAKGRQLLEGLNAFRESQSVDLASLTELSMGTSQDYLVAVEEGATWVRLGTSLLGERTSS